MSSIVLCEKRTAIVAQPGHIMVTGGPGSGKTTIALLKARERSKLLEPGQAILFLSFSRAAVQQILARSTDILSRSERASIQVQTYHAFCMEVLRAHGRLLSGHVCRFVFPSEERLRKSSYGAGWEEERQRRAIEDGEHCFDLFARSAGNLFRLSESVRRLYSQKFPLIIVDEFQDTDNDQWSLIKALALNADVACLADAEQRIFDYRPEVDPQRLEHARACLTPAEFDLGNENHRSPDAGILSYADAILQNRKPLPISKDVRGITYYGKDFDGKVHGSVIWTFAELRKRKFQRPTLAVLCRTNALVARISDTLSSSRQLDGRTLGPIEHTVIWDAELSAAAALVVASLMDCARPANIILVSTLRFMARYYHLKNAEDPATATARQAAAFDKAAERVESGKPPRLDAEKHLIMVVQNRSMFGDPIKDWLMAREVLRDIPALQPLFQDASLVRLFGARDALASGLGQRWLGLGSYSGAADLVRQVLDRERLISTERAPSGCAVMNIHKAKGKEFDGVVVVEGAYSGAFLRDATDRLPSSSGRRLLRVAFTRARSLLTLVRPNTGVSLVD